MTYKCTLVEDPAEILKGNQPIYDLNQLYATLPNSDLTHLRLEADFVDKYFTAMGLYTFLENLKIMHPNIQIEVDSQILDKRTDLIKMLAEAQDIPEILNIVASNHREIVTTLNTVSRKYLEKEAEDLSASQKLNTLYAELSNQESTNMATQRKLNLLKSDYADILTSYNTLTSRIRSTYDIDMEVNNMFKFTKPSHTFERVLYFKEISRVIYTDTVLYYLKQIVNTLYSVPTRNVVIETPLGYHKSRLYPEHANSLDLTYQDVMSSDIFMAGFQHNLMSDIFNNPMNCRFLVVLDRSGLQEVTLDVERMDVVYICSDLKDLNVSVPKNRVLSYLPDTLHIPYVESFDRLNSERKMAQYSSFPIVKYLLELLELGGSRNG